MNDIKSAEVRYLERPDGRIAYEVEGDGPLVVAVPGMGDLRSSFREVVGALRPLGYRVATMDLRGHGDSDTSFHVHGDIVTGQDLLALIDELGGPATVLGNSMGGAAAAWAAVERPHAIDGLVLYSPLLRDAKTSGAMRVVNRLLYRVALARPWGAAFWSGFYRSLNRGAHAPWLDEHVADIRASLKQPGRLASFRALTLQLDHAVVEGRVAELTAPTLALLGESDPDYVDPAAEAHWFESLGMRAELVPNAAHYPHAQRPDIVVPKTIAFLRELRSGRASASEGTQDA